MQHPTFFFKKEKIPATYKGSLRPPPPSTLGYTKSIYIHVCTYLDGFKQTQLSKGEKTGKKGGRGGGE